MRAGGLVVSRRQLDARESVNRPGHLRVVEALQGDGHRILHMDGGLPLGEIQHECQRELGDWLNTDDTGQA